MRRRKSGIIFLIIVFTFQIFHAFAGDYEAHWASSEIETLLSRNLICGDETGIRPDDVIRRAEFAKVINLMFLFQEPSNTVFADNQEGEWYFEDMQIARKAGYLTGDLDGNCNPSGELTRAEAAVIAARLLQLNLSDTKASFSDGADIPFWAAGAAGALQKLEIIQGYQDGSFRPGNVITRAEAFVMLLRCESVKQNQDRKDNSEMVSVSVLGGANAGGNGGGSSGGGTEGSSGNTKKAPNISLLNPDTYQLSWEPCEKVSKYEIIITRYTNNESARKQLETSSASINILAALEELMTEEKQPEEKFGLKIRAVGISSSYTTSYSEELLFTYHNNAVTPPQITCVQTVKEDGSETVALTWPAVKNAAGYKIFIEFDDSYVELDNSDCTANLPQEYIQRLQFKHKIKVQSLSGTEGILDSPVLERELDMPMFGGHEGQYDLIVNKRHFYNIKKAPEGIYRLERDLTLENHEPFVFSGTLAGGGRTITVQVDQTEQSAIGLFSSLTGKVDIRDLTLDGFVKGNEKVGALAGTAGIQNGSALSAGSVISNCVNKAGVTGRGKEIGGFIGDGYYGAGASELQLTGLINEGDINGASRVGGIMGIANAINISKCANIGAIKASGNECGGLIGFSYATVGKCFNSGSVMGNARTGGIIGSAALEFPITNCYNAGEITASSAAGGIVGYDLSGRIIRNCYNASAGLEDALAVAGDAADGKNTVLENCYYLSETGNGKVGSLSLSEKEMEELSRFSGFEASVWKTDNTSFYKFPQLTELPHRVKPETLQKPAAERIQHKDGMLWLLVTGDSRTLKYTVELQKDGNTLEEGESQSGGTSQKISLPADQLIDYEDYVIKITACGDGIQYLNNVFETVYTYLPSKLPAPGEPIVQWSMDETEKYHVSWDASEGASGYHIAVTDGDNVVYQIEQQEQTALELTESVVPFGKDYSVQIKALGGDPEETSETVTVLIDTRFAGGNGTNVPYQIGCERHFAFAADMPDGEYRVIRDFSLSEAYTPAAVFSGVLAGYDSQGIKEELRTITVQLTTSSTALFGLFQELGNGTQLKNLRLCGSITAENAVNVGGFGGKTAANASIRIENCINEARIKGKQTVGGFIGRGYDNAQGLLLRNLINNGEISAAIASDANAGGIIGLAGVLTQPIEGCENHGSVISSGRRIGGIAGWSYASLVKCSNTGLVSGGSKVGGLVGESVTVSPISNSYNTGNVTASGGMAGGLIGCGTKEQAVTCSYNAGEITGTNAKPICNFSSANLDGKVSDCYYLSEEKSYDGIDGTTALTSSEMGQETSFAGFDFGNVWELSGGMAYPSLQSK